MTTTKRGGCGSRNPEHVDSQTNADDERCQDGKQSDSPTLLDLRARVRKDNARRRY